jgi:hypothetical protein
VSKEDPVGPIHNFAVGAAARPARPRPDVRRDPRLGPTDTDMLVEAEFQTHPDLQTLMRELEDWYAD